MIYTGENLPILITGGSDMTVVTKITMTANSRAIVLKNLTFLRDRASAMTLFVLV